MGRVSFSSCLRTPSRCWRFTKITSPVSYLYLEFHTHLPTCLLWGHSFGSLLELSWHFSGPTHPCTPGSDCNSTACVCIIPSTNQTVSAACSDYLLSRPYTIYLNIWFRSHLRCDRQCNSFFESLSSCACSFECSVPILCSFVVLSAYLLNCRCQFPYSCY